MADVGAKTLAVSVGVAALMGVAVTGCVGGDSEGGPARPAISGDGAVAAEQACLSNRQFFVRKLWPQVLGTKCASCHTPDGIAAEEGAELSLLPATYPGFVEQNMGSLDAVIKTEYLGMPTLLAKPTGRVEHGGGLQIEEGGAEYALLEEWTKRVQQDPCADAAETASLEGIEMLSTEELYRKATLHLAGRLPRQGELDKIDKRGDGALSGLIDSLTREEAFYTRLRELFNDVMLTDRYFPRDQAINLLDEDYYPRAGDWYDSQDEQTRMLVNQAIAREPLELIVHVLRNDLSYREILTANYTVVNPYSAQFYGVSPEFKDPTDPNEWVTRKVSVYVEGEATKLPHTGLLTNPMWLNRHPTSETNRNRHRARMVMKQFLATDILTVAERPIDADEATATINPTRNDANCAGCHRQIDPIAGAFMNWSDRNMTSYVPGQPWYPEMFPPGYGTEEIETTEFINAEQWLAQRLVDDPRFALSAVHTIYQALTGHEPLAFPAIEVEENYDDALTAWELQEGAFVEIRDSFVAGGYNLRDVIEDILLSPYFRAKNVIGDGDIAPVLLRDVGTARLSTPELLARKIEAVTGIQWLRSWDRGGYLSTDYNILYGGIDSESITTRLSVPNGVMSAVQWRMANEVACNVTAWEFTLKRDDRTLLTEVDLEDEPVRGPEAVARIRKNIIHLHKQILGEDLAEGDPELEATYALFEETYNEGWPNVRDDVEDSWLPWSCGGRVNRLTGEDLPESERINEDRSYVIRSWMAVITYLLADYRFLYE